METYKKRRIAFFSAILVICTACIGITISMQMNKQYEKEIENEQPLGNMELYEIDQELFRSKFINSFDNKVTGKFNSIKKNDENKDLIYSNAIHEKIDSKYDLDINIPIINIDNEDIKKYNEEIKNIFELKIEEIKKSNTNAIYTVDYLANINNDILSLVIKATLKEGNNSQRLILKSYNYNLAKGKRVRLQELISNKNLNNKEVKNKIKEEIQKQNQEAFKLKELGYDVFVRNITEDMFELENIKTYFLDNEGYIYIIYPYGNSNLTTEMDIVVF